MCLRRRVCVPETEVVTRCDRIGFRWFQRLEFFRLLDCSKLSLTFSVEIAAPVYIPIVSRLPCASVAGSLALYAMKKLLSSIVDGC